MTAIQPQVYLPQQGVVVSQNAPSNYRPGYAGTASTVLGALQLTGGILVIIFQIVLTIILSAAMYTGAGIWCGIFYILAGSFGIAAGKTKTFGLIITYMVLSIIAALCTIGIIAGAGLGLGIDKYSYNYYYGNLISISFAFNVLLLLVGVVELITLIIGSCFACRTCCCQQQNTTHAVPIQYGSGQTMVTVGPSGKQVVSPGQQPMNMQAQPPQYGQQPMNMQAPPPQYATGPPPNKY